jgi:glycosylphosphatidylinositol transamidase
MIGDRFKHHRRSAKSLMRLLYGALIPTLAMVNFPQAILLASLVLTADSGIMMQLLGVAIIPIGFGARGWNMGRLLPQMQAEWALGNVTYPAAYAVVIPLISALWCFSR